jgi:hypothetical protein
MRRFSKVTVVAAAASALALLAGCVPEDHQGTGSLGDAPPSSLAPTTAVAPTTAPTQSEPVLPDGRSPIILKSVDVEHRTVTFDLIELYLGAQAMVEWKKDHPNETVEPPLNGHYMRNNNPKLRTLPVATDVVVNVLDDLGDPAPNNAIPFAQLATHHSVHGVYWITVKGGAVTMFQEQFFP